MKKHPVTWFYILAFSFSWLGMIPAALSSHGIAPFTSPYFQLLSIFIIIGPALAAVIVTQIELGKTGIRNLLKGLMQWRVGLGWYLIAILGAVMLFVAAQAITRLLGFLIPSAGSPSISFPVIIFAFLINLVANTSEEIGWRGFVLPRLQKRYNALFATLIVGILWGLWHLPFFFWVGNPMSSFLSQVSSK